MEGARWIKTGHPFGGDSLSRVVRINANGEQRFLSGYVGEFFAFCRVECEPESFKDAKYRIYKQLARYVELRSDGIGTCEHGRGILRAEFMGTVIDKNTGNIGTTQLTRGEGSARGRGTSS